jgi:alkylation response protein AidB-like acyl-CoA dehydrogenase
VFSAAQLVGIAEACRDAAAEHAKTRIQFDRPIGVNQAIKHPCANAAIRAEAAWCQTAMAAVMHDEGLAGSRREALCARIVAAEAAEQNAATLVQVMGGMGFTFEHDAHLYVKRAQVLCRMLGDTRALLEELIAL